MEELKALLRQGVSFLSGLAVAKGWLGADAATQLVALAPAVGMLFWSIYQKRHQAKVVEVALSMPADTTPTELKQAVKAAA
jgi:hypothetical protein